MVDARLPDGSRVNAVIPPIALDGSLLTIRKFAADPFTDRDLISFGTMSPPVRDFLEACVRGRRNIIISRRHRLREDDDSQRAELLPPGDERIITIEDAAELQLHQEHVLRLSRARRTSRAAAQSRSATSCATRCVCDPTESSSARSATAQHSTCSRP